MCQHCKQYSFECTFFLPITETRFKKKKLEEEAAAAAAEKEKEAAERSTSSPQAEHPKGGDIKVYGEHPFIFPPQRRPLVNPAQVRPPLLTCSIRTPWSPRGHTKHTTCGTTTRGT